jgi:hypothetical protein
MSICLPIQTRAIFSNSVTLISAILGENFSNYHLLNLFTMLRLWSFLSSFYTTIFMHFCITIRTTCPAEPMFFYLIIHNFLIFSLYKISILTLHPLFPVHLCLFVSEPCSASPVEFVRPAKLFFQLPKQVLTPFSSLKYRANLHEDICDTRSVYSFS